MQGANSKDSPFFKVSAYGSDLKKEKEHKIQENLKKQELYDERLKKVMKENKDIKSKLEKKSDDQVEAGIPRTTLRKQEAKPSSIINVNNKLRNSSEEPTRGKIGSLTLKDGLVGNEYSSDPESKPKKIKTRRNQEKEEFSFEKDFENLKNSQSGANYKEVFANGIILHNNHQQMAKRGVSETGSRNSESLATLSKKLPGTAETESKKQKTDVSIFLPPLSKNNGLQLNLERPELNKKNETGGNMNKGSQSTKNDKGGQIDMRQSSHLLRHEMMNLNLKEKILQNDLVRFNAEKSERIKQLERKHQIRPNYTAAKELFVQPVYEKPFNPPFDVLYEEDLEISLERIDFLIKQKQIKGKKEEKSLASSHLVVFPKLQSHQNGFAPQEQERNKSKLVNQKDVITQRSPKSTIPQAKGSGKQETDQIKVDQTTKRKNEKPEKSEHDKNLDLEATFGRRVANNARDFSAFDERGEPSVMRKSEALSNYELKTQGETGRFNERQGFEKNSSGFDKNFGSMERIPNGTDRGGSLFEQRESSLEKQSDGFGPSINSTPLMSVDKNRMSVVSEGGTSTISEGEQNMSYSELKKYREEMKRGIMIKHERLKNKINDISSTKKTGKGVQANEKKTKNLARSQEKLKASGNQENMLHEIAEVDDEEHGGRISIHQGNDLRKVLIVEEDDDEELNEFL